MNINDLLVHLSDDELTTLQADVYAEATRRAIVKVDAGEMPAARITGDKIKDIKDYRRAHLCTLFVAKLVVERAYRLTEELTK